MEAENTRSGSGKRSGDPDGDRDTPEPDPGSGKKRRKQLNPVRHIPDSLPSRMVQVPIKDEVVDSCSEPALVPQAKPPAQRCPLRDVPFQNDILPETASTNVPIVDSGPSGPSLSTFHPIPFTYQPWTDRAQKIFNQEAYCELCKKEFCNKYFLKTHKANKHGIYSTDCNVPVRHYVEPSTALAEPPEMSGSEQDDKYRAVCELCNKSFCNRYFVRRHMSKCHGVTDLEELNAVQSYSTNDARSTLTLGDSPNTDNFSESDEKDEPLNLVVKVEGDLSNDSPQEDGTENIEKLQTMLQRLHPESGEILGNSDDSTEQEPTEFNLEADVAQPTRKQSKPTSSYCEICNKELCNKYFMRTHMQRMHGIELEHGAQIGGVVCNICNKELCSKYFLRVHKQNTHGVPGPAGLPVPVMRPDNKTPPRPTFSQSCVICSKRFRSSKWLQAHLQSDHLAPSSSPAEPSPNTNAPVDVISKLFWEGNREGSGTYNCSLCPFATPILAFLFVHERSHVVGTSEATEDVKPSLALQELIHQKTFWQHAITQPPEGLDLSHRPLPQPDS